MKQAAHTPLALIILDGWGVAPEAADNAIDKAQTPVWDALWAKHPHSTLEASGHSVGLPDGQMGNSEVGHLHIGAGRVFPQDLVRINEAIADKSFFQNAALLQSLEACAKAGGRLHILGLCSDGGVHSHINHLLAAIQLAAEQPNVPCNVHAILDGRDTPPQSAAPMLQHIMDALAAHPDGHLASMTGRFYAMDRDQRWERTERAYQCFTEASPEKSSDALAILKQHAQDGHTDEFVPPTALDHTPIQDGDVVWFLNFRADRARQICQALAAPDHTPFNANAPKLTELVTLTDYGLQPSPTIAFPAEHIQDTLGRSLSEAGLKQLRLAETEKYAHVTYFLNGGREEPYPMEDRQLIPSPKVSTYDLAPEMSAVAVTDAFIQSLKTHDVIICNFANADMVGHTGEQGAAETAVTAIDQCLGRIAQALREVNGHALITADHGNAEQMFDAQTQQPHTAHTSNPVPLLYLGDHIQHLSSGALTDIAPTVLSLLNCPIPKSMTGKNLADNP